MSLNSECCLWYDGKHGRRSDSKISNQPVTFELNCIGTSNSNSNLEASQVPSIKSVPNSLQLATGEVCDIDDIEVAHIRFAYLCLVLMLVSLFYVINVKNFHRSLIIVVRMTPLKQQISPIPFSIQKGDNT